MMTNRFVYATTEEAATSTGYLLMPTGRSAAGHAAAARYDVFSLVVEIYRSIARWRRFRKTFNELSELDERILQDIGLRRDDIGQTASRLAESYEDAMPRVW